MNRASMGSAWRRAGTAATVLVLALGMALLLRAGIRWLEPGGAVITCYRDTNLTHRVGWIIRERADFYAAARVLPWMPADHFALRWSAWLDVPSEGVYEFASLSNDGLRLWLDDQLVLDRWRVQAWETSHAEAQVRLAQGRHRLRLDFFDAEGGARLRVEWCGGPSPPRTVLAAPHLRKRWSDN